MYKDYEINRIDHNLCMPDQPIWKEYGAVWNCRTVFFGVMANFRKPLQLKSDNMDGDLGILVI